MGIFGRGKNDDDRNVTKKKVQYEYKTELIVGGLIHGASGKADDKIKEMQRKGWELVDTKTHGTADRLTVQFRREKK